ncbi:hypothetical protein SteCoe_21705 [Stentor coeruleus]|uniref:Uncharacterized protein n=1 Tax=Stentor coeruleus TaxID=5963 RepID=A0A1R2BNY2_9CILI|nr:hypothetical protein SteCoe_21705 [Stentor coeruleus]
MARVAMSSPLPLKNEPQSSKDVSNAFKSLKRSLKDTLERLETIGINDIDSSEDISVLKAHLLQKDRIIQDQSSEIERLKSLLASNPQRIEPHNSTHNTETKFDFANAEIVQNARNLLLKVQEFTDFIEVLSKKITSITQFLNSIKNRNYEEILLVTIQTFLDFIDFVKYKYGESKRLMDSREYRNSPGLIYKASSPTSKYSDIDQEILDKKKVFSDLCKEISQSLNPVSMNSCSEIED